MIKKRQLLAITAIAAGILIICSYSYYRYEKNTIQSKIYDELEAIASLKINHLVQWKKEREGNGGVLMKGEFLREVAGQYIYNKKNTSYASQILAYLDLLKSQYGYSNIIITSADGEMFLSANPGIYIPDSVTKSNIQEASEVQKIIFNDFHMDPVNRISLEIIAPLLNNQDQTFAVIILQIDPSDYLYPLIQSWPTKSRTAETIILRRENDDIIFLNELRHKKNTALTLRISMKNKEVSGVQAVLGKTGIVEGIDYRNEKVIADIRPVRDTPWFMVTKVDKRELFSELYYRAVLIILVTIGLLVLLGIAMAWFYNSRQKNIYKLLLETGTALEDSQKEYKTALYSIGDAVITTDTEGFIRNMNPVAEQLTGWKEAEALHKNLTEVFRITDEDPSQPLKNPVERILREGKVAAFNDHSRLISKKGNKIPITANGTPIKNENGKIKGVILVFRDQSGEQAQKRALIESEKRFRSTLDNMLEGCQIIGFDWRYLYLNHTADIHNRRTKEELLGNKYMEMWPGIEDTEIFQIIRRCMEERIPRHLENIFVFPDGSAGWFDLSIQPVPEGVFILSVDITDRKQAEDTLREKEGRLREAQEMAHLGFWRWDIKTGNVEWSDEVYKIFKKDPGVFTPTINSILDLSPWTEDHQRDKELIDRATKDRDQGSFEQRFLQPDGSTGYYYSTFRGIYDESGNLISIHGTVLDITDRKKTENNERLAHEILDILNNTENTETMVTTIIESVKRSTDIEAVGIRLNEGDDYPYYKTIGFSADFVKAENYLCTRDELGDVVYNDKGEPLLDCMCGNILCGRVDPARSFFTSGGSFRSNNTSQLLAETTPADRLARTRNRCNSAGYESVAIIPIRSGQKIIGLLQLNDHRVNWFSTETIPFFESLASNIGIALMRNRSEELIRKLNSDLEQRILQRTGELENLNKELEAFSYSVSHDLRAPLRHIAGFTELLAKDFSSELPEKAHHYMETIFMSAKQMGILIDDLLQLSKTGRSDLKKSTFNMDQLVDEVLLKAIPQCKDRSVDWNISRLTEVNADYNLLRQVWTNLIDNALKYTRKKEQTIIEVGYTGDKDEFIFHIRDNGVGFDMKYTDKLFGVFQRLHSADEFEGSGIGLANVRRIISRHGGKTWAEGEPERGAVFYFSLPK